MQRPTKGSRRLTKCQHAFEVVLKHSRTWNLRPSWWQKNSSGLYSRVCAQGVGVGFGVESLRCNLWGLQDLCLELVGNPWN